ncbi:vWA domain-containing protein [Polyangium mundeleinium]|uniref:VWA domain-containing protein n=1 Tax=Polyangium mundeleinium TaxID=2995306 RepID=A0ABT5EP57_9BACT|nr:VWA domain-containing protein [Polyangium mundeleinium]MDC0742707.1 VWA domain-containing protein [Polyangium mundeleinium]
MSRMSKSGTSMILGSLCLASVVGGGGCTKAAPSNEEAPALSPDEPNTRAKGEQGFLADDAKQEAQAGKYGVRGGDMSRAPGDAPAAAEKAKAGGAAAPPPAPTQALIPPAANDAPTIDPNGRFATTYRPGGGHLAAFESAVARGIIPAGERELVSDIGARYVTGFEVPKGKALGIQAGLERGKLPPSGSPFHLRLTLKSSPDKPAERPHLSVHLVLDVSGSMQGESIKQAREAASALVDKLAPSDDFSLVTFSTDAEVKIPDGPVGARREAIKKVIAEIKEGGGTNISSGLELGYAQAETKTIPQDAVKVVLLLSDGRANSGIKSASGISKLALDAFQKGIQTSTFGLGTDYDGALMSAIAEDGAGGYYYLRDAAQIAPALGTELDKRLDPAATAVEVRVRLKKGFDLLKVYGSRRLSEAEAQRVRAQEVAADEQAAKRDNIKQDRKEDNEGGMRFFIPAFAAGDSHALLFQLRAGAGVGKGQLALVELKYKDRISKKNVTEEFPVDIEWADSDAASGATIDGSVARTIQGFAAGETLARAAQNVAGGDKQSAISLLTERETILREAAKTLEEPLFLKDADRLARMREHAAQSTGMGDPLLFAMLLETASRSHLR